ncbi:hypothetical protein ADK60_28280 [Streptomyces sp. XY431]|uniref:DUF11 domain-containing protein n=1 Tax=Streptomyces sp. XY431 TaxID=1415562 RepID=UPI0006AEB0BF|nr:DUF11 domain-containing protein [Streptomyces sp. XY431]KOV14824.1 hypothetical protein ADK60_28280 [Streptomyces sp. XY431]
MSRLLLSRALRAACAAVLLSAGPAAADACAAGADLAVSAADPAPVRDGGSTLLHPVVTNTGGTATAVPFTLYVHLPPGVVGTGQSPTATCTTLPHGHTVACTVPAGLAPGASATAEVRISVASGMDPEVLDGTVEAELPDDPTPDNNSSTFRITVI